MHLTSNDCCCRGFYLITNAAVGAAVLREAFPDVELVDAAALLDLVFVSVGKDSVSLCPLHGDPRLGQLTAQCNNTALLHLNILQVLKKFDRPL